MNYTYVYVLLLNAILLSSVSSCLKSQSQSRLRLTPSSLNAKSEEMQTSTDDFALFSEESMEEAPDVMSPNPDSAGGDY